MPALFPRLAALAAAALTAAGVLAQQPAPPSPLPAKPPAQPSALDAPLFYQLLIGELELRDGRAGNAYQVLLDAARRTRDGALFERAVEIAVQARAGDQAMAAAQAWRESLPQSADAARTQLQLAAALNKLDAVADPLAALLRLASEAERPGLIASLPRLFARANDRAQVAQLLERTLAPHLRQSTTRAAARVAIGRAWLQAGDKPRALAWAQEAQQADPAASGPVLLALDLLPGGDAEKIVARYLDQPDAEPAVQMAYVRVLIQAQRYNDALRALDAMTQRQPTLAAPWLTLGALRVELRESAAAEAALQRYLALRETASANPAADDDGDAEPVQAWLLLAEAAEQRGDWAGAEAWLARVGSGTQTLDVHLRRATLLARQGRVDAARELIRRTPERRPEDARAKLVAEAQVLRQVKRWDDAYAVLASADERFPNDADLLYELAMMAEKLGRIDEMERLLRRVMEIRPTQQHAYNALGYSLADRNLRLPEARALIQRALELSPGDPFITDSLGWVEYRLGNRAEALRLLRQAYATRPDPEIAAHLGEVLWSLGEHDEARRIWREARERDAANEVLTETLARLGVRL
jgi:tetratricopeptide (TPR) repeat protein